MTRRCLVSGVLRTLTPTPASTSTPTPTPTPTRVSQVILSASSLFATTPDGTTTLEYLQTIYEAVHNSNPDPSSKPNAGPEPLSNAFLDSDPTPKTPKCRPQPHLQQATPNP